MRPPTDMGSGWSQTPLRVSSESLHTAATQFCRSLPGGQACEMAHPEETRGRYERIIRRSDGWYFETRERIRLGPFSNYLEALTVADDLTSRIAEQPWNSRKVIEKFVRERDPAGDRIRSRTPHSPRTPGWDSALRAAHQVKATLDQTHRGFVLQRAIRKVRQDLRANILPSDELLSRLRFGWGNEGWSASEDFLRGCIEDALRCHGAILECGSGLTTLAIGIIAEQRGLPFVSLEHSADWYERTNSVAAALSIRGVCIKYSPLRRYGNYCWYEFDESFHQRFSLVICDGPPGQTHGGRYGLLPVAQSTFSDGCVILVDDAVRSGEQAVVRRWQKEASLRCETLGRTTPYFRLT
jgi:hypothetical protein